MENIRPVCEIRLSCMMCFGPECETPGYGLAGLESGAPCYWCGTPNDDWQAKSKT